MNRGVRIRSEILKAMGEHARSEPSLECCGLLAERDGVITDAYATENIARDPVRSYEIAPKEIVRFMREFRTQGLEFVGIYHSHPTGENKPSARDIEQAYYSEAVYFVLSPRPDVTKPIRAFSIRDGQVTELRIEAV
jgi:proteasome lid subunit RPN8/RPN11